jgi:serine/threonine protein kinase
VSDPLIGTQLDEYRLESLLGQGGMARVYRGLDTGLQRYAAVKVIDTPHQQDEGYIARFEREARAIAALDHPHIVSVYRYGRAQNLLYLAMKYIEGADLHAILNGYEQDGQLMPLPEVVRLLREMGSALDYAHSRGVIHRDVKPSNVMLDGQGRSYITDFGLALLADVGTRGEILGSPHYIAPEQAISSAGAVPQSDLYALGVILYRMVTGQLPFVHDDLLELLMMHMTAVPPSPRTIRPEISPALEAVILQALAKEPAARFASGQALATAVENALKEATAVPLTAASALTIVDRVALDKETLPPVLAVTPLMPASPPTTPSPPAPGFPLSPRGVAGALVLLALVVTAIFLIRGRADEGEVVVRETAVAATTITPDAGTATAAPAEVVDVALPGETADVLTAVPVATGSVMPIETAVPPELLSPSSSQVYLPLIARVDEALNVTAVASTPIPTPFPVATAEQVTDTPSSIVYRLLITANGEDSLFVVNQSAESFPLALLRLGSGRRLIQGTEWGLTQLEPGACVTAWKDTGNPQPPDVSCQEAGERLIRKGPERFWKDPFEVFYDDAQVGICDAPESCLIEIVR